MNQHSSFTAAMLHDFSHALVINAHVFDMKQNDMSHTNAYALSIDMQSNLTQPSK